MSEPQVENTTHFIQAIEAAQWAKTRLENYYRDVRAGKMDGGDRELERRIWAAFSDFDEACRKLEGVKVDSVPVSIADRAKDLIELLASQKLYEEMSDETKEAADFVDGYNTMVKGIRGLRRALTHVLRLDRVPTDVRSFSRNPSISVIGRMIVGETVVVRVDLDTLVEAEVDEQPVQSEPPDEWGDVVVDVVLTSGELDVKYGNSTDTITIRAGKASKHAFFEATVTPEASKNRSVQIHANLMFEGRRCGYAKRTFEVEPIAPETFYEVILHRIADVAQGRDSLDGFPRGKDEKQRRLAEIYELAFEATK